MCRLPVYLSATIRGMDLLTLQNVTKRYKDTVAVDAVTMGIPRGTIFGLLGPNGAGKTSLIRMITSITAPDSGSIILDSQRITDRRTREIGYLPEERGLYKKMKVGDQLSYLARLKGLSAQETRDSLKFWLNKFEITDWWNKKIEELSKGMQQKIQFISTVVHNPKLIILDEPFTGLDPINTNLIKAEIRRLNQEGATIIFSTHRMEQVEEICEEIALINKGKCILQGKVADVKENHKQHVFRIQFAGKLPQHLQSEYEVIKDSDHELWVKFSDLKQGNQLLSQLINEGYEIQSFQEILPSLNDIFIQLVENESHG